ncbi:MAG: UDP-glucose:(heptosyl)LPS alpha-1,3-glucosyltransferase [Candidatus Azotimanducaceae bacterium]|jgi:UDP-glucose:(heptosyl)LPS alpha-1,3-glucosyltransferase
MKLGFCIYKYFPYGGLQRDFIRMARECIRRGHTVRIFVLKWAGPIPTDLDVTVVPVSALFNHTKYRKFSEYLARALESNPVDCVVGFNKMPGLDVYYAADSCYEEKARSQRGWLYRKMNRYKHFAEYESAVFSEASCTEILSISDVQKPFFIQHYHTQESRFHTLPPGISRDRIAPTNAEAIRREKRKELGLKQTDKLILLVGSGFVKKGLKRAILAVDSLPTEWRKRVKFIAIGEDNARRFNRLIKRLDLESNVKILGGTGDIPAFMLAGDFLLHPALDENAGMVLLEAMVAGLPVLTTEICGYGHYVKSAEMGRLIPEPFQQKCLNQTLLAMLVHNHRERWRENGYNFAQSADIYSLPQRAVSVIEEVMNRN